MNNDREKIRKKMEEINRSMKHAERISYILMIVMITTLAGMVYLCRWSIYKEIYLLTGAYQGEIIRKGKGNGFLYLNRVSLSEWKRNSIQPCTYNPLLAEVSVFLVALQSMSAVVLVTASVYDGGLPYPHRVPFPVLTDSRIWENSQSYGSDVPYVRLAHHLPPYVFILTMQKSV